MRTEAALTGLALLVWASAAAAQPPASGLADRPPERPLAAAAPPDSRRDSEIKERRRLESEARDRKREARLKRVMGSVCERC